LDRSKNVPRVETTRLPRDGDIDKRTRSAKMTQRFRYRSFPPIDCIRSILPPLAGRGSCHAMASFDYSAGETGSHEEASRMSEFAFSMSCDIFVLESPSNFNQRPK
jgi:hypothetical protein